MKNCTIQLQNQDGSHCRWITPGEAQRMEDKKQARRVSRRKEATHRYRLIQLEAPSESANSMPVLTMHDFEVAIGFKRATQESIERLVGFGLLHERVAIARGYL